MNKHIELDLKSTAHIKYGNLEQPAAAPVVRKLTAAQIEQRTPAQKRKDEFGE